MAHGPGPSGAQSSETGLGRETCPVPCLPWFEPGPFSNVLEACHIPLYINYGSWRLVLEDCEMIESVRKSEGIRSFLDECRNAGLSSSILILKSLYRVCPNLIPRQGCAAPVFRVKSQSDKSHCYCFSRWAIDGFSMAHGSNRRLFCIETMEDRTIVFPQLMKKEAEGRTGGWAPFRIKAWWIFFPPGNCSVRRALSNFGNDIRAPD